MLLLAISSVGAWSAETPLDIATNYPKNKTFTITSWGPNGNPHKQMCAASADATSASSVDAPTVSKDDLYRFAFVPDPQNPSNYYLYNVGTKRFVTSVNGDLTAHLYTDYDGSLTPVFVYNPNPSHNHIASTDTTNYNRAIAFGSANLVYQPSSSGSGGSTNNTYHMLAIGVGNNKNLVEITDWTWLGAGAGAYSLSIADANVQFTVEELVEAQAMLKSYQSAKLTDFGYGLNTIYTLTTMGGATLVANGSSISATTSPTEGDVNTQFVFVSDATDVSKIYLYSVGQKKFLNANGRLVDGSTVYTNIAAPVNFFATDVNGYPFAISLSASWLGGSSNFNVSGSSLNINNVSVKSTNNQFVATAFSGATFDETEARRHLVAMNDASYKSISDVWLTPNTVKYTLRTNKDEMNNGSPNFRGGLMAYDDMFTTTSIARQDTSYNDPRQQFVFVTNIDGDTSAPYIYNVAQEKFVAGTNATHTGTFTNTNPKAVYFGRTNSYDYWVGFSFNNAVAWNTPSSSSDYANGLFLNINTSNLLIGNYNTLNDNGTKFQATNVGTFTDAELAAARSFLSGYTATTFDDAQLGTTDNKVYTFTTEAGGKLYASGTSLFTNATAEDSDPYAQFMFYTADNGNVYLYSVGAKQFVTSSMALGSGSGAGVVTVFDTKDSHGYNLAFKVGGTNFLHAASATGATTDPDKANRFMVTEVATPDASLSIDEVKTIFSGAYTLSSLSELGIDPSKVYYLESDNYSGTFDNTTQLGHVIAAGSSRYNRMDWFSQAKPNGFGNISANYQPNAYFAFVTKADDPTTYYLYSVNVRAAANSNGDLVTGTNKQRVYVYKTNDKDYPLAIGFASTWADGKNLDATANNTTNKLTSASTSLGPSKRWRFTEVPNVSTYDLSIARDVLDNVHRRVTLKESGIDPNKVYSITSVRSTWYSDGSQLRGTSPNGTTVDKTTTQYQFAFYTDSTTNNVYLYNVGSQKFVSKSNQNGTFTGGANDAIYIYRTNNSTYPYLISFNSNLTNFSHGSGGRTNSYLVINGAVDVIDNGTLTKGTFSINDWTTLDDGNQLNFVPVEGATYDQTIAQAALKGWMTTPFHYKGESGANFMQNGMQDVAEVHYYYYVSKDAYYKGDVDNKQNLTDGVSDGSYYHHGIELDLPYYNYNGDPDNNGSAYNGNNQEPNAYTRWYNYSTDSMTTKTEKITVDGVERTIPRITPNATATHYYEMQNGHSLGLFFLDKESPSQTKVGVIFNIPDAGYDKWTGDTIACDVSRYYDYNDANIANKETLTSNSASINVSTFNHEPTLSVRYVFHILPAERIADAITTAACNKAEGADKTFEDNKILVFGVMPSSQGEHRSSGSVNVRANLHSLDHYWFHPLKNPAANKHVYYPDVSDAQATYHYDENDFDPTRTLQAKQIEWRVYNNSRTAYRVITTTTGSNRGRVGKDINITMTDIASGNNNTYALQPSGGSSWTKVDGTGTVANNADDPILIGKECYLVGYLVNGSDKAPFFNADLHIDSLYPMSRAQIAADNQVERSYDYLESNFSKVASFTFDNENSSQNSSQAGGNYTKDNFSPSPSNFSSRQYGFLYYSLRNLNKHLPGKTTEDPVSKDLNPIHGEYSIIKQKNNGGTMYDRTHERDSLLYGYFMNTDCSQEARKMGHQDFEGNICPGTKVLFSAWVCNFSTGSDRSQSDQPELRFSLYGINKDANGNDVDTKLMASVCSGKFDNNIRGYKASESGGVWYQVFNEFVLPTTSGVDNYSQYRITIDNYCQSTRGADYCIDDIMVYQNNAKLTALQDPTMCSSDEASSVKIKVKVNYEILKELEANRGDNDQKVYLRFRRSDGSFVKGIYGKDASGKDLDYLTFDISGNYDENAKLTAPDDVSTNKYDIDIAGNQELVLVNRHFNLEDGVRYYLSLALRNPADSLSWGANNNICSFYSSTFQLLTQSIVINGGSTNVATMTVPCGYPSDYKDYHAITPTLTAASKLTTGQTTLPGVPFDWFVSNSATGTDAQKEFLGISKSFTDGDKETTVYLSQAIEDFRAVYGNAQPKKGDTQYTSKSVTDEAGNVTATFTEHEWELINDNLYDASQAVSNRGRLVMSYSTSFADYPINVGTTILLAIPAVEEFTYNGQQYQLCDNPQPIVLRAIQDGPAMQLGIKGVVYPSTVTDRSIRVGLPQLRKMAGTNGELRIPIVSRLYAQHKAAHGDFTFVKGTSSATDSEAADKEKTAAWSHVYISDTNDPTINLTDGTDEGSTWIADVTSTALPHKSDNEDDYFALTNFKVDKLHEGYWYELVVRYTRSNVFDDEEKTAEEELSGITVRNNCIGETYFTIKIVPEYVTWDPQVTTGFNSNWNVDNNWRRSTAEELLDPDYKDYRAATYSYKLYSDNKQTEENSITLQNPVCTETEVSAMVSSQQPHSYVPMYFTKVIIPTLTDRPYPIVPFIRYNADTHLITETPNVKNAEPTANIQYDMMASPVIGIDEAEKATSGVTYRCINFDGDSCEQIYYKNGAQLREQQFLRYKKAWVEIAVPVNTWATFTTPMKQTNSGEMYMPKFTANQSTPLFRDIYFTDIDSARNDKGALDANGQYGRFGAPNNTLYSRMRLPVYQRLWGQSGQEVDPGHAPSEYPSYDDPSTMLIWPDASTGDSLNIRGGATWDEKSAPNAWSHAFNYMSNADADSQIEGNGVYAAGKGVAGKVGDIYTDYSHVDSIPFNFGGTTVKMLGALLRLPKADKEYYFYRWDPNARGGKGAEVKDTRVKDPQRVNRADSVAYRLGIDYDFTEGSLGRRTFRTSSLSPSRWILKDPKDWKTPGDSSQIKFPDDYKFNVHGLAYDLIGNPYTASISVDQFIQANSAEIDTVMRPVSATDNTLVPTRCVWVLVGSQLLEYQYGNGNVLSPGTAFFVKLARPGGMGSVYFTTRMQVDPDLNTSNAAKVASVTEAKRYRIDTTTDIEKVISGGGPVLRCYSAGSGWLNVEVDEGSLQSIRVYNTMGQLVNSLKTGDGASTSAMTHRSARVQTGQGMFIVQAVTTNGKMLTAKVMVR